MANQSNMSEKNVKISAATHNAAAQLVIEKGILLGKFVDNAVKEKVEKEKKKK